MEKSEVKTERGSLPVGKKRDSTAPWRSTATEKRKGSSRQRPVSRERPNGSKMTDFIRRIWGLPGFFANPFRLGGTVTLGIDFGTKSIKLVLLRRRGKAVDAIRTKVIRRPVADVGQKGQIEESVPLIKNAVRGIREQINTVVASVQGPAVVVRRVNVPPMPKSEIKSAIPWVIEKFLPYPIENAIFDYRILGEDESTGEMQLLVAVAEKEWVQRVVSQLKKIGLPPSSITIGPIALENILHHLGVEEDHYNVVINIGERVTSINFYLGSQILFSRDIMTAGESIASSLTGKVTYKGKEFTIDSKMAEELKCRHGIPMGQLPEFTENGIPFASIQALIRPTIERLIAEIDRSLKYAERNYEIRNIQRILLTGGSANLINLKKSLTTALGAKVAVFDPIRAIDSIRDTLDKRSFGIFKKFGVSLSIALGLALEKGRGLNFLSTGVQDLRKTALEKKLVRTAACLILLIIAGTSLNLAVKQNINRKKLTATYAMLESIERSPSYEEVRTIQDRLREVEQLLKGFKVDRKFTSLLLKDISHRLPEGIVLKDLTLIRKRISEDPYGDPQSYNDPAGQLGEEMRPEYSGWELALEGLTTYPMALSEPVLTVIMLDLESSPFLKRPELVSLKVAEDDQIEAMEFYIKCEVVRSGRVNQKFL
jgi:type IV pilus assembly protein PilM